ncbi:PIN/TRAM domain-containing protein [Garciella nitratireducens]|uniref:Uncharacterized conserved protein YacL, contains PIN and TRAM domains n=1 Tax=Garciella nitratireducens DSM 15102 TaxID=1121911 RepID=A0A1T4PL00_9FIRM|nr:PIN/TRAM domain-containing protein [Garciella nitratireducens]RBP44849.1 uncharacterized protein YacL [Garciella nitratireducens]SJZ92253.1 Uncharacterized conserved protein YacL, contains PIN and TRAM domains [Garciella nitratireducens DSM 15102]
MVNKIMRSLLVILGMILGQQAMYYAIRLIPGLEITPVFAIISYIIGALIGGLVLFMISPKIIKKGKQSTYRMEKNLEKMSINEIVFGVLGLIVGLVIASLVSFPINNVPIPWIGNIISFILYIILGYLGYSLATKKKDELLNLSTLFKKHAKENKEIKQGKEEYGIAKILDTSVIIDGRIFDICKTGFIEGPLIIPHFVLEELRHIADSSDSLKRNRGRRGLDILNKIQKELSILVKISEKDFSDVMEVDVKLLKLAQYFNGKVVTNDYNLNKVAEFQGVEVLNINELANAVKPVVLPGEEMEVQVIKDGKESGQGIAYLDDGTMIVVENGKKHVGETIEVIVTSVLQTAAGRMIFSRRKESERVNHKVS